MNLSLQHFQPFEHRAPTSRPKVAISACLNGEAVRYDGSSKPLQSTSTMLCNYLQLIPICPEVGAGMSIPRPPIQLVEREGSLFATGRDNPGLDVTRALDEFRQLSSALHGQELSGYILKSRSPSCGLDSTPVFGADGSIVRLGSGMQADYFRQHQPWLQMTDELSLAEYSQMEHYVVRCLALEDVKIQGNQGTLENLHHHYLPLIQSMSDSHQACIGSALATAHPARYWQAFGIGLQSLA